MDHTLTLWGLIGKTWEGAGSNDSRVMLRALRDVVMNFGAPGLDVLMRAMSAQYLFHFSGGNPLVRVSSSASAQAMNADTGALHDPGDAQIPARVGWAARVLAAVNAERIDEVDALLEELPDELPEALSYVASLVMVVRDSTDNLPFGLATLGRGVDQ